MYYLLSALVLIEEKERLENRMDMFDELNIEYNKMMNGHDKRMMLRNLQYKKKIITSTIVNIRNQLDKTFPVRNIYLSIHLFLITVRRAINEKTH